MSTGTAADAISEQGMVGLCVVEAVQWGRLPSSSCGMQRITANADVVQERRKLEAVIGRQPNCRCCVCSSRHTRVQTKAGGIRALSGETAAIHRREFLVHRREERVDDCLEERARGLVTAQS